MDSGYRRVTNELDVKVIDDNAETLKPIIRPNAVTRTQAAIKARGDDSGAWDQNRINQARAFVSRAKKSGAKRKREKASRKANRKR